MAKIRVAVIGCGSIAEKRHIPEYAANPDVELVAFVDVVNQRAEQYADQYGAKAYTSYEEMLSVEKPDAVSVCLPNILHAPVSIAAANAGAHVLVEKPMATNEADSLAMIEAAKANNVYLMVGHNQRLMPPHVKAKEILETGKMGKVLTFRTSFGHPGPENWSIDGRNSWFFRKEEAIMGAMGDLGVHKSDLIRWLLEDEVVEVAAFVGTLHKEGTDVDDNSTCLLRMKSGAIGTLVASWTYYKGQDNSTVLWCENGCLQLGTHPDDQVIVLMTDGSVEKHQVGAMATNEKQVSSEIINEFVYCIKTSTPPRISGEEGLRSLNVILAAFESQASKTIVAVKEV
ncbi:Gfo/Idh/MocA family protein [Paenibacillus agricola]|uniref:Gfo/Idh/MocA family oxidoreductase n=1 Tax=Paenibacillus agricola TaxID=2716264 RepID=A0ABX0J3M1_9BACL|nr:Gfo/Idh/MocA family oxidoreductase [Paenibacillus agricola]NHN28584.1 Gfo/Idh/MocA family oxidoreductase [Paenibacillus agricola]